MPLLGETLADLRETPDIADRDTELLADLLDRVGFAVADPAIQNPYFGDRPCAEGCSEASEFSAAGVVLAAVAANAGGAREFPPPLCAESTDDSD